MPTREGKISFDFRISLFSVKTRMNQIKKLGKAIHPKETQEWINPTVLSEIDGFCIKINPKLHTQKQDVNVAHA